MLVVLRCGLDVGGTEATAIANCAIDSAAAASGEREGMRTMVGLETGKWGFLWMRLELGDVGRRVSTETGRFVGCSGLSVFLCGTRARRFLNQRTALCGGILMEVAKMWRSALVGEGLISKREMRCVNCSGVARYLLCFGFPFGWVGGC